jgi:uncharacterized RDD family membrane protein YckC
MAAIAAEGDAMEPQSPWERTPPAEPPAAPPATTGPVVNWAPPPTTPEIPGAPGLSFADTPTRLIAYIIDGVLLAIVGFIIAAVLGQGQTTVVQTGSGNLRSYYVGTANPIVTAVFALVSGAYFIYSWSGGRRATVGQRLLQLQVGNAFDGRSLSTSQAFRRWLGLGWFLSVLAFLPGFGALSSLVQLLWTLALAVTTATSPTKQGLHDRFANSAVVRPAGQGTSSLALACAVIIGLFVILAIVGFLSLLLLGPAFFEELSRVGRSI